MGLAGLTALIGRHAHETLTLDQTGLIDQKAQGFTRAVEALFEQAGEGRIKRVSRVIGIKNRSTEGLMMGTLFQC